MAEEEVGLRLALKDRRQTVAGLDDVGDKLDRVGDEASQAGRKARIGAAGLISFGKSGRIAGRAVVYGFGAASAAVVGAGIALGKLSKDSIAEAREAQKVSAITRREIRNQGKDATYTARQVSRLSGAISEKVGMDDEQIQTGANLLITFHKVQNQLGKGNKIYNRAVQAATDLSVQFGSVESGAKMVGKALQDPVKGITALGRAGVTYSATQIARIKRFAEENNILRAQKIILGEVEDQVGGVAEAQATWGDKAKVSLGNIEESFGTALLPMLDRTEKWFVQKGAPVLEDWVAISEKRGIPTIERYAGLFADKAVPAIGDFLDEARPLAKSIIPAIGTGLSTAADAFQVIAPRAKQVFDAFNDLPDWAKTGISLGVLGGAAAKKLGAFDRGSLLGSIATTAKPLPVFVVNNGVPTPGTPGGKKPFAGPIGITAAIAAANGALTFLGLKTVQKGMGQDAAHGAAGVPLGASHGGFGGSYVSSKLVANQTLADALTGSLSHAGKELSLGAKNAAEFDLALQNLSHQKGPEEATLAFMKYADTVGFTRDALAKATPQFAGMMEVWRDQAIRLGVSLNGIDRTYRPTVYLDGVGTAELRVESLQSKLDQLAGQGIGLTASPPAAPRLKAPRAPKHDDRSPAGRAMTPSSYDDYFGDLPPLEPQHITVQSILDGRVIAESTVRHLDDRLATR